jgi:biopolymer transport protein ExbD
MRRRLHRRTAGHDPGEINITAFMNLMVILVPFLLITAVFSRITILELNLPAAGAARTEDTPAFQLEVIVRSNAIEVGDRNGGLITRIDAGEAGHDFQQLSEIMQQVKARFPDKLDVTVLLESEIAYEILVQVMDSVRVAPVVQAGSLQFAELFPEISIGDAPANTTVASRKRP